MPAAGHRDTVLTGTTLNRQGPGRLHGARADPALAGRVA
jgi:hypothetical protein